MVDVDLGRGAKLRIHRLRCRLDNLPNGVAVLLAEAAESTLHIDLIRYHICRSVSHDFANRKHCILVVYGVQHRHKVRCSNHRIVQLLAHCSVSALAAHPKAQLVVGSHKLALAEPQLANLQTAIGVFANDRYDIVALERPLRQHLRCATRVALLARLEDAKDCPLEIAPLGKAQKHSVEHRCVDVVSAGVHHTAPLRCVLQARLLLDGESVNIGTQNHGLREVALALNLCQNACLGYARVRNARLGETLFDILCALLLLEREFGMAVQMSAKFYCRNHCAISFISNSLLQFLPVTKMRLVALS